MRTITFIICKFEELSDDAKEKARQWWREQEKADPAFLYDHMKSKYEASKWLKQREPGDWDDLLKESKEMRWTGYTDDYIFYDAFEDKSAEDFDNTEEMVSYLSEAYEEAWSKDLYERLTNNEYIDDIITSNDYEFYEDGTFFNSKKLPFSPDD